MPNSKSFHNPFDHEILDKKIKENFHEIADDLQVSSDLECHIKQSIITESRKEFFTMKHTPIKRIAAIAGILCMTTVTVFAAGKITAIIGSSSSIPEYTSVPTEKQLEKDLGFAPDIPTSFKNGYLFKSANISDKSAIDDKGNVLNKYKSLMVSYENGNSVDKKSYLTLNVIQSKNSYNSDDETVLKEKYNDTTFSYSEYSIKFLPVDYEMTEQDKADEASGKYSFSYGSDEVEVSNYRTVSWTQDDIVYSLTACNLDLTQDELITMAKETLK